MATYAVLHTAEDGATSIFGTWKSRDRAEEWAARLEAAVDLRYERVEMHRVLPPALVEEGP